MLPFTIFNSNDLFARCNFSKYTIIATIWDCFIFTYLTILIILYQKFGYLKSDLSMISFAPLPVLYRYASIIINNCYY